MHPTQIQIPTSVTFEAEWILAKQKHIKPQMGLDGLNIYSSHVNCKASTELYELSESLLLKIWLVFLPDTDKPTCISETKIFMCRNFIVFICVELSFCLVPIILTWAGKFLLCICCQFDVFFYLIKCFTATEILF